MQNSITGPVVEIGDSGTPVYGLGLVDRVNGLRLESRPNGLRLDARPNGLLLEALAKICLDGVVGAL